MCDSLLKIHVKFPFGTPFRVFIELCFSRLFAKYIRKCPRNVIVGSWSVAVLFLIIIHNGYHQLLLCLRIPEKTATFSSSLHVNDHPPLHCAFYVFCSG